jgi:hypothetical protein
LVAHEPNNALRALWAQSKAIAYSRRRASGMQAFRFACFGSFLKFCPLVSRNGACDTVIGCCAKDDTDCDQPEMVDGLHAP